MQKRPQSVKGEEGPCQAVTLRFWCSALPTELGSHWRWEQVNFGFICSQTLVASYSVGLLVDQSIAPEL